jgi:hypothetical protein
MRDVMSGTIKSKLALALAAAVCLAGCGKIREGASGYYLSQVRKTLALREPSRAEMEGAYAAIGKSLQYRPDSIRSLETLKALTGKAGDVGFAGGLDLEIAILKRVLRGSPFNWPVYAAAVNDFSVRGDLYSLNELAAVLEAAGSPKDARQTYEIYTGLALCYASMAPWVESEGYLSLNKTPETLIEKAREYVRVRRRAGEMQAYLAKADAVDPAWRKLVPEALRVSAEVALGDLAGSGAEAERIYASVARMDSEPAFLKAVALTVQGNGALMKKDYSGARAFYRSAMQNQPGFIDARKQLVEVDFQEGAGLALTDAGLKSGRQLLYRAYEESDEVIETALEKQNWMPFLTRDKFLADTYSIRAAVISAVSAIEKGRLKNKAKLEGEFKSALDEAVRLNPQGKLARDLLERYSKEGF